jgi:peroxiredoxin Q/BCP
MHRGYWIVAGLLAAAGGMARAADLQPGTPAPPIEAQDQHGATVRLADFQGKANVVLYFYPKDDTPGCTAEACSLRDGQDAIRKTGAVVLGVSADDTVSHKAFAEKYHLNFSILADPDKKVIQAYGVKSLLMLGRASRVTFIIDRTGVIRHVIKHVDTASHDKQVLEFLKRLS